MDPITVAIVAALTVGATSGLSETTKALITDAYQSLKNLIKKKVSEKSHLITSIEVLETKPQSVGRQHTLNEDITEAQLDHDQDILQAAHRLYSLIQDESNGEQHLQHIIGNYNAIVQGSGNATVNVNQPDQ